MNIQNFEKQKTFAPFLGEPLLHIVGQDPLGLLNTGGKTFDLLLEISVILTTHFQFKVSM